MSESGTSFEDFIPTDKWSLQDWYLSKVVLLDRLYQRIVRSHYMGAVDRRALIDFYAAVQTYLASARHNIKKYLQPKEGSDEFRSLIDLLAAGPKDIDFDGANRIMRLLSDFHWRSGLTKLEESRPTGPLARARAPLGLQKGGD